MTTMTRKMTFRFNTALMGLDDQGKFQEQKFKAMIAPIRADIMSLDGMSGFHVETSRYGMWVNFEADVLDEATVERYVERVIAVFANRSESDGYFPLRGDKQPQAVKVESPPVTPSPIVWVQITFTSSLISFPVRDPSGGVSAEMFDEKVFRSTTRSLADKMPGIDGVHDMDLQLFSGALRVDTDITPAAVVEVHLRNLFTEAAQEAWYFPYLGGEVPIFTFQVGEYLMG